MELSPTFKTLKKVEMCGRCLIEVDPEEGKEKKNFRRDS